MRHRQVLTAHVDAICPAGQGQVHLVVEDQGDVIPAAQRPQAVREGLRNGMGEQNLPGLAGQGLGGGLDILCPKEAGDHGDARRAGPL